jgi:hypothetical protein
MLSESLLLVVVSSSHIKGSRTLILEVKVIFYKRSRPLLSFLSCTYVTSLDFVRIACIVSLPVLHLAEALCPELSLLSQSGPASLRRGCKSSQLRGSRASWLLVAI